MAVGGAMANTVMVLATVTLVMIATTIGGHWTRDQQRSSTCSIQNLRKQCESTNNCVWDGDTFECKESQRFSSAGIKSSSSNNGTLCVDVVACTFLNGHHMNLMGVHSFYPNYSLHCQTHTESCTSSTTFRVDSRCRCYSCGGNADVSSKFFVPDRCTYCQRHRSQCDTCKV